MTSLGFSSLFSTRRTHCAMWFLEILLLILSFSDIASAAGAAAWRSRSIYQVFTDRFARPDGSTTAACSTSDRLYCGGTWQGLIKQLDYIQGMGFTAVVSTMMGIDVSRGIVLTLYYSGSHQLPSKFPKTQATGECSSVHVHKHC
jgi:hypothetical protein